MFLNLPYNCVSFLFPHNFCKETHCFLENFTLLEKKNFYDRWSRQISSLCGYYSNEFIFLPALGEFLYILKYNLPPLI